MFRRHRRGSLAHIKRDFSISFLYYCSKLELVIVVVVGTDPHNPSYQCNNSRAAARSKGVVVIGTPGPANVHYPRWFVLVRNKTFPLRRV